MLPKLYDIILIWTNQKTETPPADQVLWDDDIEGK